jgi:thiamine-monophosphate kinase
VKQVGKAPRGYAAIGDDVAFFPPGKGKLVAKVDMLVEHTDVPPGMTYRQAARKAVAMCVSDFAAKGVKPDSFMVSLGLRKGVTQEEVDALAEGFRDAEREWKVHLVGGDTNESEELVIDCAMLGFAMRIVPRDGSSPGDSLVVTGRFGYTRAGLDILTRSAKAEADFRRRATASVLLPTPNLRMGIGIAPYLTSAMDSSDGLARSLYTLARASGVGFELTSLPIADGVKKFASSNGLDPETLVLQGGEEYVVVGTVRRRKLGAARRAARKAGGELLEIGTTTSSGRVELLTGGARRPVEDEGWTHLR